MERLPKLSLLIALGAALVGGTLAGCSGDAAVTAEEEQIFREPVRERPDGAAPPAAPTTQ